MTRITCAELCRQVHLSRLMNGQKFIWTILLFSAFSIFSTQEVHACETLQDCVDKVLEANAEVDTVMQSLQDVRELNAAQGTRITELEAEIAALKDTIPTYSLSGIRRIVHMDRSITNSDVSRQPIVHEGSILNINNSFCVLTAIKGRFDGSPEVFSVYTVNGGWHFTHKGGAASIGGAIDCYSYPVLTQN